MALWTAPKPNHPVKAHPMPHIRPPFLGAGVTDILTPPGKVRGGQRPINKVRGGVASFDLIH